MSSFLSRYLGSGTLPSREGIRSELWADGPEQSALSAATQALILEQYRIYTEMADRISARRGLTNTFFLSINTAVAAFVAERWKGGPAALGFAFFLMAVMLVGAGAVRGDLHCRLHRPRRLLSLSGDRGALPSGCP